MLVDFLGSLKLKRRHLRALRDAGAEVAWFNPVTLRIFRGRRADFRSHRKIVVCDGRVGFTGGMNITDAHTAEFTGDRAWRDADGYFWFVGRDDDVIISAGYRIGPFEVESALIEHPAVVEAAAVAAPDPDRGSIVKAFVVVRDGFTPSDALARELQEHVKRVTAPYKYPRAIEFAKELPKTVSGKIRRVELRNR